MSFQFTDQDADIVRYVHELRVATLDHLAALTDRSQKTLERRVPKLRNERYIRRLKPRPHKGLYIVGPEGMNVLVRGGYAPEGLADKRRREPEWKDLFIPHALFVASIHTRLLVLSRQGPIKLAMWQHDHPNLWDSVIANGKKLPIRTDAFFALKHTERPAGKNRLHFFLEADVGTMSHQTIEQKIIAYSAYSQQQLHVRKFGINYFQVAIVTQTVARAENLKTDLHPAMSAGQRRAYHIIPFDELTLDALLAGLQKRPT
jgi:hypothetical protein